MSNIQTVILLSDFQNRCLTFFRPGDRDYYLGYRFWEGQPKIDAPVRKGYDQQPACSGQAPPLQSRKLLQLNQLGLVGADWLGSYEDPVQAQDGRMRFRSYADGYARAEIIDYGGFLNLDLYFEPDETGIRMRMSAISSKAIEGSFCLQQCLRFTGAMNAAWRTRISHVPYLSELDMHAMGRPNATLTYCRQGNAWRQFPVEHTMYQTKSWKGGAGKSGEIGIDHGLILRESPHREEAPGWYWDRVAPGTNWDQVAAGLYWERTAWVSNRHPADCVHAWIDLGPLGRDQSRIIHGKVYYMEGSKNTLLTAWERDFKGTA